MGLFAAMLLPEWYPNVASGALVLGYMIVLAFTVLGLFALAVGLPAGLVLAKTRSSSSQVRGWWRLAIVGLLLFALVGVTLTHIRNGLPMSSHVLPFDAAEWAKPSSIVGGDLVTIRQKMLGDLVDRVLPSRTREEIIAVLGVPRERPEFTELCYPLGNERGSLFALDAEYLIVHFDRNGRYSHVGVHVD